MVKRPLSISLGTAGSISQAFDRGGRVTSDGRSLAGLTGDAGTGTQAFTYDAASRLTGSTGLAVARSYQYDLDGNRTRRVEGAVTTDVTYDRADQQISQVIGGVTRTFTYDRYGNLTQSADAANALTTYAYDEASRLTTITPPAGGQVSFTLDALDRHATRAVAGTGTTDTYAYLDATETAWQTGTGSTTSLLDADGSRLAVKTAGTVSWLVFDLHGSVVALCPAGSTTLTDAYRFDGWGQQIAVAGSAVNPFRYRGLLNIGADSLTGALLDMAARHYSPQTGTFTSEDSVAGGAANPATMNRFLYALANPATLIDPDGHRACLDTGGSCVVSPELDAQVATRQVTARQSYTSGVTLRGATPEPVQPWTCADPGCGPGTAVDAAILQSMLDLAAFERECGTLQAVYCEIESGSIYVTPPDVFLDFPNSITRNRLAGKAWERTLMRSLGYDPAKYAVLWDKSLKNLAGKTVYVGGNYIRPDFQIVDRNTGMTVFVRQARIGSKAYLADGQTMLARTRMFVARLGYAAPDVIADFKLRPRPVQPTSRLATGVGFLMLAGIVAGGLNGSLAEDLYYMLNIRMPECRCG